MILVFGRHGQVASEIAALASSSSRPVRLMGRDTCDLLREDAGETIRRLQPSAVINASGYTAVDQAEKEPEAAFRLNRDVVGEMAVAAAEFDAPFVHLSTDYVFDGEKSEPYVETDAVNPLGVYGRSKLEGEEAVAAAGGRWSLFRTAWVFSPYGANFIKTMLKLGSERDSLSVVEDQTGRPTFARDIAAMALRAADPDDGEELRGCFHLAGADDAVWADVAERVFEEIGRTQGRRPELIRIPTSAYPTPARRPANSRLDTGKLQAAAGWAPRPWRETVDLCLQALA